MNAPLPSLPGSYALHLRLEAEAQVAVGRLGCRPFPPGEYVYLGSAHGPGGVAARLGRHLRGSSRPHWHIDHLRPIATPCGYAYIVGQAPRECEWSAALAALPAARPVPGFGASDCRLRCSAHLIAFPPGWRFDTPAVRQVLGADTVVVALPCHA